MTGANAGWVASTPVSITAASHVPPVYPFVHQVSAWIAYALTSIWRETGRSSEIRATHGFIANEGIEARGRIAKTAGRTAVFPPTSPPDSETAASTSEIRGERSASACA